MITASCKDGVSLRHVPGPQGVRGRNSDNSLMRQTLGWQPQTQLEQGLRETYEWIERQVVDCGLAPAFNSRERRRREKNSPRRR